MPLKFRSEQKERNNTFIARTLYFPLNLIYKKVKHIFWKKRYIRVYLCLLLSWENKYFNQSSNNVFLVYISNSTIPHMKYHAQTIILYLFLS